MRAPDRATQSDQSGHRSPWAPAHIGHGMAVFDLDRTLIEGSSLVHLGRALVRHGVVPRAMVARQAMLQVGFQHRGVGDGRVQRLVTTMLRAAEGLEAEMLATIARDTGTAVAEHVHPAARWLLDRHRVAGDFCVILSASPVELVEGVAMALGAHRAVGTRIGVRDGRCTGALDGPFCYGRGKLAALEREVGRVDLSAATAYADSASDLPLLEECGTAVAVNPDAGLRRAAAEHGWPVLRFG